MKTKIEAGCSLDVAEDPLDERQVCVAQRVHVQAHLLDVIDDVGPCEHEVLKRPRHASIPGDVRE
jgi:hypothetical protein